MHPVWVFMPDFPDSVEIALVNDGVTLYQHEFLITRDTDGAMLLS